MSIQLREKLGKAIFSGSKATRGQLTAQQSNALNTSWLNRLGATSNTGESRETHSQLASILDFYNRPAESGARKVCY